MQNRRFSWLFLISIIALVPLLAACGLFEGNGDGDETEEAETPTEEVAETPEETGEATEEATEEADETAPEGTPEEDATPEGDEPAPSEGTPEAENGEAEDVGAEIFNTTCAACHQPEGEGIEGIYPALAGNPFVTGDNPDPVINVVLSGRGGMPRFEGAYSNEEIAAIVSYIRTDWENDASEVSPEDVEEVRQELEGGDEEDPEEGGGGQSEETSGDDEDGENGDSEDDEEEDSN